MKKKLSLLFAAAILLVSTTFANSNIQPSQQVQNSFNRLFAKSTEVNWEAVSSLYQVRFLQGGQYLTAFFDTAGNIESVSRNISVPSLPLLLQKGVQDKLTNAWVSESFELVGREGTTYYVTIENNTAKTIYRASGSNWTLYKTIKK